MYLLGISAYYHDSAAAIIRDGEIIAAAQEERFTRIKHDDAFPINAVKYCLNEAGIELKDIAAIAFYEKPFIKFERLLETYLAFAPAGLLSFIKSMSIWTRQKLFIKKSIRENLRELDDEAVKTIRFLFPDHHLSHACSSYFSSGFEEAAILVVDAVGESTTTSIFYAQSNQLTLIRRQGFPHSLGLLYSAFTYWLGFRVNSGEYKLMGLAPFGNRDSDEVERFKKIIRDNLLKIYEDGSIWLNQKYFTYATGFRMVDDEKWETLFGFPRRSDKDELAQHHADLAMAIQDITEEILLKLARHAREITGSKNLCLAGGVALNCVANSKILNSGLFENIFVQPAAGDAGGALGAAQAAWYIYFGNQVAIKSSEEILKHSYLGPGFSCESIEETLKRSGIIYIKPEKEKLFTETAKLIADGNIAGWFQGRMEFGPRALGNRSILADPRNTEMQKRLNLKTKFREGFRPFAPAVKIESAKDWFCIDEASPYMLFVHELRTKISKPAQFDQLSIEDKLSFPKSPLPAITHADYSARIQTVSGQSNEKFWNLLDAFYQLTGCPVLINTSFNVRGEPIVCTPGDAISCFMGSGMDVLVIGDFILIKSDQSSSLIGKFSNRKFADD